VDAIRRAQKAPQDILIELGCQVETHWRCAPKMPRPTTVYDREQLRLTASVNPQTVLLHMVSRLALPFTGHLQFTSSHTLPLADAQKCYGQFDLCLVSRSSPSVVRMLLSQCAAGVDEQAGHAAAAAQLCECLSNQSPVVSALVCSADACRWWVLYGTLNSPVRLSLIGDNVLQDDGHYVTLAATMLQLLRIADGHEAAHTAPMQLFAQSQLPLQSQPPEQFLATAGQIPVMS